MHCPKGYNSDSTISHKFFHRCVDFMIADCIDDVCGHSVGNKKSYDVEYS